VQLCLISFIETGCYCLLFSSFLQLHGKKLCVELGVSNFLVSWSWKGHFGTKTCVNFWNWIIFSGLSTPLNFLAPPPKTRICCISLTTCKCNFIWGPKDAECRSFYLSLIHMIQLSGQFFTITQKKLFLL